MSNSWIFGIGLALLCALGGLIGRRLPQEYRRNLRPSFQTVAAVWAFYAVHFSLVAVAAVGSVVKLVEK